MCHSYGIYYSCFFYKYFCRAIDAIDFVLYTCKNQYQKALKIRKIDYNLQNKRFITQYQSFNMNSLVCAFCKKVRSFKGNYLDLLFKHQDI